MSSLPLNTLTLHEAARGLREKKFSSLELTEACIKRIEAVEPAVKAFVLQTAQAAREQARACDAARTKGDAKSCAALFGIPAALKDVFCTQGVGTTACSHILKNFVPPYDATSVRKLKDAGMVLLGKVNTDEFTCGGSTESSAFGTTHNPWNVEHTPGGSSGGSAAAVAADECIYALGTDTGGSIRQPAAYCGITGLKVTYGRVSRFGVISMASSLDTIGPMAKDVEDVGHIMNVIAGPDAYDSTTPQVAVPDYTAALTRSDLKGLRIGLPKEYFIPGMDSEVEASVRAAVKECEKLGATIHEISLPHTKYGLAVYYVLCPSEVSANMARYDGIRFGPGPSTSPSSLEEYYLTSRAEGFGDEMKRRIMIGTYALSSGYYDAYYLKAQKVRTLVRRDFDEAFQSVDVIITPTTPSTAFKIGENASDPVKMYLEDVFTVSINIAGLPALAVPCGISSKGLPIGMQIIGSQFTEDTLIGVGAVFQRATDWHTRKPKL